jgi:hypothetical protein
MLEGTNPAFSKSLGGGNSNGATLILEQSHDRVEQLVAGFAAECGDRHPAKYRVGVVEKLLRGVDEGNEILAFSHRYFVPEGRKPALPMSSLDPR